MNEDEKKEYRRSYMRNYYHNNKDKCKKIMKNYQESHKEEQQEYRKKYYKEYHKKKKKKMEDKNQIVTISYKDLTFEIDVLGNYIFLPEEVIDLFPEDEKHIEIQPTCLFFSRLVRNYDMKIEYNKQINGSVDGIM